MVPSQEQKGDGTVYRVFRQLENGELVQVASRDELEQAVKLVEALSEVFPGKYAARDSEGNDLELSEVPERPALQPKRGVRPNTKRFDKHKSHRQSYY
jgi:hypothetical protein